MLDLEDLKFHQKQGVWRYCHSNKKEFGDKTAVEKWKYVLFESILRDVLRLQPSGEKEDIVVRAVLDRIPQEIKNDVRDAETALRITQHDLEFRDTIIRRSRKGQPATLRLKKEAMPDAPMHLADLSRNVAQAIGVCEFDIICSCKNNDFTVGYIATCIQDDPDGSVQFADLHSGRDQLFSFEIKCDHCDERHHLFDKWSHGWDGFHRYLEFGPPTGTFPAYTSFSCPACKGLPHKIHVSTLVDDEFDDFKTHYRDNVSLFKGVKMKDAWSSTFSSIEIGLTCSGCGAELADITYETA